MNRPFVLLLDSSSWFRGRGREHLNYDPGGKQTAGNFLPKSINGLFCGWKAPLQVDRFCDGGDNV